MYDFHKLGICGTWRILDISRVKLSTKPRWEISGTWGIVASNRQFWSNIINQVKGTVRFCIRYYEWKLLAQEIVARATLDRFCTGWLRQTGNLWAMKNRASDRQFWSNSINQAKGNRKISNCLTSTNWELVVHEE